MTRQKLIRGVILCTFIFGNTISTVWAQADYQEVVYLKNGSIIHGMIIEWIPDESIKIKTNNHDVILFRIDEVQKITREELTPANPKREPVTDDNVKTHGFSSIIEFVYLSGINNNKTSPYFPSNPSTLGFMTVNGYMFDPHACTGIGIGIQGYDDIAIIPVYANVRYNLVKGTISPFTSFDFGYSFTTDEIADPDESQIRGGIYSNLSIGIKFFTRRTQALAISFGYNYQGIQQYVFQKDYLVEEYSWEDTPRESMALKLSIVF